MPHVLDNPIWNALNTGCAHFALGSKHVKYFNRDVALFAGMDNYSEENFKTLNEYSASGDSFILFTPEPITVPLEWEIKLNKTMLQMVYQKEIPQPPDDETVVPLTEAHVPLMQDLTKRTNPGPFFKKTILFGNYMGMFDAGRLIAMAGQRLSVSGYSEVSAVCTDPEYSGKGYAKKLMLHLLQKIMSGGSTPMLHLYKHNTVALNLYLKLGFEIRREQQVYFIQRK